MWCIRCPTCLLSITTKYLSHQIASIVWTDSDIIVAALIEVIHCLTTYRVCYDKASKANEHTLPLLSGDWKEAYANVSRMLSVISHFHSRMKCVMDIGGKWLPSPLVAFPCPTHDPSHDEWQSKQCVDAPSFYVHGTLPPLCLAKPLNRGKISPLDLQ
jgi:hypothetical protein